MMSRLTSRLQVRLILAFVLVLLIPTAIITAYGSITATNQLVEAARSNALQNSRRVATSIEDFLSRTRSDTLFLSRAAGTRNYVDAIAANDTAAARAALSSIQTVFLAYSQNVLIYDQIRFIDKSGQELVRINLANNRASIVSRANLQNIADAGYLQKALALPQDAVLISPLSLKTNAQNQVVKPYVPVITLSTPVYTSLGGVGGAVVVTLLAQPVLSLVESDNPGEVGFLVDSDGTYLASPDEAKLYGRDLKTGTTLTKDYPRDSTQVLSQLEGTLYATADQPEALQVFTRVVLAGQSDIQWTLYYVQQTSAILGSITNLRIVTVVIALIALLIAVLVAIFISQRIARPVQALTRSAIAISEGDLTQQVSVALEDNTEIGRLANAFNKMSQQLAISYATLEKRVEERTAQLAISQQRAETASRAKSIFLSNISHELRTPLNVVIGYTSSMLNMPQMYDHLKLPDIYQKDIQLIMDNGRYLLGLINDILDLSKIEAGKLDLHRSNVDLIEIFQGVIATSVGLVKDKPIQVRPDYPTALPRVFADPMRVRQIILNLMSNAAKFTQTGSITLHAHATANEVFISVTDTGIGIPEKALAHIFDRYQQAEQDTEKQYGGTGLGLDISKQLSIMHGSDLTVTSKVGQGSTFSFTLPIAETQVATETPRSDEPERVAMVFDTGSVNMASSTVLIVEDDAPLREMFHRALEESGFVVLDTDDGARASEMALGLLPDIILLDVKLPNVDGWQILKELKDNPETASIPVLVCTGGDGQEQAGRYTRTSYLRKPITAEQILVAVRGTLAFATQ